MEWTYVDSSYLVAVRVNYESNYVDIMFKSQRKFRYEGAASHYEGLLSGTGKYFNQHMRDWPYTEIFD